MAFGSRRQRLVRKRPAFDPASEALFRAMTEQPNNTRKEAIDRYIRGLKEDGVWDNLGIFYVLAAHHEQAGRLNWKDPGTYSLTAVNSPTFVENKGFDFDGSTTYMSTTLQVGTAHTAGLYTTDDASIGSYVTDHPTPTTVANEATAGGSGYSAGGNSMRPFMGTGYIGTNITSDGNSANRNVHWETHIGYAGLDRQNSTTIEAYQNGLSLGTATFNSADASDNTGTFRIGCIGSGDHHSGTIAMVFWGTQLGTAGHLAMYERTREFLREIASDTYLPEAQVLFDKATGQPSTARKQLINELIDGLIRDGLWDKLALFYVLAAHDSGAAKLNWKKPDSYTLIENNTPTFTTDRGYAGNGTDMYLNTGITYNNVADIEYDNFSTGAYVNDHPTPTTKEVGPIIGGSGALVNAIIPYQLDTPDRLTAWLDNAGSHDQSVATSFL